MNKLSELIVLILIVLLFLVSMLIWIVSIFSGDSAGIAIGFSLMVVSATALSFWAD